MSVPQSLLDHALTLAALGIPVFPCRSTNKRPVVEGGFKVASADLETVARMFADPAAGLIGVPTGPASGFCAIDIDTKRGGLEWLAENESRLPPTRRHHTRSGGVHLLLRDYPGMRTRFDRIAPGVEVRGDGGYIIWWPAMGFHAEGSGWADWPDWLVIAALSGKRDPGTPPPAPDELAAPSVADLLAVLHAMPNPADATRGEYVALNLAVAGCIRAMEALGRCDPADADEIRDAAADWSARWDSATASDFEHERARWEKDWDTRTNDISGWRHILGLADRCGADTSAYRTAAAVAEFGALPLETAEPVAAIEALPTRVLIRITADNLTDQIDAAEAAVIAGEFGLYQRAGAVVRVGQVQERSRTGAKRPLYRMVEVDDSHLRELIGRCADFQRFDARAKEWQPTRCPPDVPRGYLARRSLEWRLPHLAGIVTAPTLRHDGTVLQAPGYDEATGLLFDPRGESFPEIPERPTREDAAAGLALLRELLTEFQFVDEGSRAVALSAILTALIRRSLPAAPMHAVTAPAPGTGKSYLLEIICRIAFGQPAAGCDYSDDEAENRKQIDAALLAGMPVLILDNVQAELQGARLNQILTQERVTLRVLGHSKNADVPCDAFVMANGNNLMVAADMTRRTVLCRMDANCERPETREFRQDPLAMIQADRGRFVAAALTVLRAYHVAGRPGQPKPLGSFEVWSGLVRGALVWLGGADPAATIEAVRANDPKRADFLAVIEQWGRLLGDRSVTAHDVIEAAGRDYDFRDALLVVAGIGGALNGKRLGYWLRANRGKIVNGMKLLTDGLRDGATLWRLDGARSLPAGAAIDFATERARRPTTIPADIADLAG